MNSSIQQKSKYNINTHGVNLGVCQACMDQQALWPLPCLYSYSICLSYHVDKYPSSFSAFEPLVISSSID